MRTAECLARVLSFNGLPTSIFVDDSFAFCHGRVVVEARQVMQRLYRAIGFPPSSAAPELGGAMKGEAQNDNFEMDNEVTALGMTWRRTNEGQSIRVADKRLKKLQKRYNDFMAEPQKPALKKVEQLTGSMMSCIHFRSRKKWASRIRACYEFCRPEKWAGIKPKQWSSNESIVRKTFVKAMNVISDMEPEHVTIWRVNKPPAVLYTDASLEGSQSVMGGVLIRHNRPAKAFSLRWDLKSYMTGKDKEVPRFKGVPLGINVLEAAAVYLALKIWNKEVEDSFVYSFVDNICAALSVVKGTGDSRLTVGLADQINDGANDIWMAWISTKRNLADATTRSERCQLVKQVTGAETMQLDSRWIQHLCKVMAQVV